MFCPKCRVLSCPPACPLTPRQGKLLSHDRPRQSPGTTGHIYLPSDWHATGRVRQVLREIGSILVGGETEVIQYDFDFYMDTLHCNLKLSIDQDCVMTQLFNTTARSPLLIDFLQKCRLNLNHQNISVQKKFVAIINYNLLIEIHNVFSIDEMV